jgi:methyl-accepting chemotaxis protein
VTQINQTGEHLLAITSAIEKINAMGVQIATAAEQQSAVAEEMNKNLVQISRLSDETSCASTSVTAVAGQLTGLGHELQGIIGQFHLERPR